MQKYTICYLILLQFLIKLLLKMNIMTQELCGKNCLQQNKLQIEKKDLFVRFFENILNSLQRKISFYDIL